MLTLTPAGPTDAAPGTPEKVEMMRARAARRLPLFHPGDAAADPLLCRATATTPRGLAKLRSLPVGVTLQRGKYIARIGRERKYLGSFATAREAGEAVERAKEAEAATGK